MKDPQVRAYVPFVGPFDPCKPIGIRTYLVPPQLFIPFQPMGWPQYSPAEALRVGTLWPALFSPYTSKKTKERAVESDGEGAAEGL
ncbi:spore coat associated protein CotJA [Paenibacillus barcinonensis]|uniref:Spore coat associated protein CotJA n=1 Tax=Paenibacillus barcinonensis TaxID=198119 RepID=A0A2V4WVD6_PAEBA|nr:spore coat associated protein CotJA [Paenibacillus barcinonensis]PYE52567.1 spore coat protein JA [Paenibacillus barcinonensis]QKS59283.1 spore coat associated protein CotJA [Paenibacillus barcinonensis]